MKRSGVSVVCSGGRLHKRNPDCRLMTLQSTMPGTIAFWRIPGSGEDRMGDQEIRAALDRHWAASDVNDFETEHSIYHEDAVLEYPQSGERIRGRRNIQITRTQQPSKKRFVIQRII